jgi:polyphosphate glucokinase
MNDAHVLGIDIGGSSVKGAIIDVSIGAMVTDRLEFPHQPLTNLSSLVDSINKVRRQSGYNGDQAGIGFQGVVAGTSILNGPNIGSEVRGTTLSE